VRGRRRLRDGEDDDHVDDRGNDHLDDGGGVTDVARRPDGPR
jgi:hypothetical protein